MTANIAISSVEVYWAGGSDYWITIFNQSDADQFPTGVLSGVDNIICSIDTGVGGFVVIDIGYLIYDEGESPPETATWLAVFTIISGDLGEGGLFPLTSEAAAPTSITWNESTTINDNWQITSNAAVSWSENTSLTDNWQATTSTAVSWNESTTVIDSWIVGFAAASWNESITVSDGWKITDIAATGVAYSLASNAITELSNMRFNGSVNFNKKTLFFNEQGLFEYGGTTDDGEQSIPLSLKTGALNFGTQHLKLIPTTKVYVLANKTDGDLGLNVTVDDVTYNYLNSLQYDYFKTYRFGIGRGLRGVYWQFEISGSGVSRLMIDSIELEPQEIRRRA